MSRYTVFYSWQSDLPNTTNRSFIEKSLQNAAKAIRADDSLKVEPVVDRDTQGVPGSPDIGKTILDKIDQAQVFVADVSIINQGEKRPSPNPNVLIELGYAMKGMGPDKYLLVMNIANGSPEQLPFDLRMKRVITYRMDTETAERAPERKVLEGKLEEALRAVIAVCEATPAGPRVPTVVDQLKSAIERGQPNQAQMARKYMEELTALIVSLAPDFSRKEERDELLMRAIDSAKPLIAEFCAVSELIAAMNAVQAAQGIYRGFGKLLEHYDTPAGFSGHSVDSDFDFFKFMGHEMFVTFVAHLIREERWDMLADLLDEDMIVTNARGGRTGAVSFNHVSKHVRLLDDRNSRLSLKRASLHADMLIGLHKDTDIGGYLSVEEFIGADYFLFLRSVIQGETTPYRFEWRPWSALYLNRPPQFLLKAVQIRYAEKLLRPLRLGNVELLRKRLAERSALLVQLFSSRDPDYENPLRDFDTASVASR